MLRPICTLTSSATRDVGQKEQRHEQFSGSGFEMTDFSKARLYVDGKLRAAANGATYPDINPWTGEVFAVAPDASVADMDEAIAAARRAFDETGWSTDRALRVAVVRRFTVLMKGGRDRLAELARKEGGA